MVVRQFTITGNTLIAESALIEVLKSYTNRALTMAQLQEAADAVVQFYLDNGYLARTILPKQDVTEGVVRIRVIESSFSGVEIEGNLQERRIAEPHLRGIIDEQIKPGDPMSLKKLERGLLLADDLPGVNVSGRLVAGVNDLTTGVVLSVTDEPVFYGEGAIDNYGSRSTGPIRLTVNGNVNGPLKLGDQISLFGMKTQGIDFMRMGLSLPVGYDGWRVGTNVSHLQYKVIEGLAAKGTSTVLGLDSSYPVYRSRSDNLFFVNNLDKKFFNNIDALIGTTTHYNSVVASSGFNGSMTDKILPGGLTSGSVMLSYGYIDLNGSPNQAADLATVKTHGNFQKIKYSATHTQNINSGLSGFVSFSGQFASKNLDSSEKFYLGGPLGVRAYPNNEGGGSEGQLLTLELRQNLSNDFGLTAFYDHGQVTVNKRNDFAGAANPNNLTYRGAGLQLAWYGPKNLNVKAIWSRRLGENPYPSEARTDQDGSKTLNRFWLSASIPF